MSWKAWVMIGCTLLLTGFCIGTFSIPVGRCTPPRPPEDLNETRLVERLAWEIIADENITVLPNNITVPPRLRTYIPDPGYYGILPKSLMDLVVQTMVSAWVAVFASCLTFYSLSRRFVWSRRKTLLVSISTVVGGVSLTLISWFHQVKPYVLDAEYIYHGYPFVWLTASRSTFWGSPSWQSNVQLYGLAGNIAFYMWLIFGSLVGITVLYERIRKIHGL